MSIENIYIFSQPIRSGKTTLLGNWVGKQNKAYGMLSPDVDGMRKLYNISLKEHHNLQKGDDDGINTVSIGRYHFDDQVFEIGRRILLSALPANPKWLIIDEVGKLEVEQHKGFEPAVTTVIEHYKTRAIVGNLLLVIRDTLLQRAIDKYKLDKAIVIDKDFFL